MRNVVGWVECNGTHHLRKCGGFRYTPPTLHLGYIIFGEILYFSFEFTFKITDGEKNGRQYPGNV